jgi:gliding motility-associated-like protein
MTGFTKLIAISSLMLLSVFETYAQPVWVKGTPAVASTGPLSITMNYGIDRIGTVYIIVYNYNNTTIYSSSTVRTLAILGPSGTIVATAVLSVKSTNIGKILQTILNVTNPNQIHTIYIVAADSKAVLQASPVRLNATTLQCPDANAGLGGNECDLNFALNAIPVFGTGIWTLVSGPGTASFSPNASTPTATVTVRAYGTYVFRWTETQGACKSSDEITVNFYQPPVANAGSGGDECDLNFVLQAISGSSGVTGTWTMTSGTGTATFSPNANSPTATVTVSEYGTKVFTWTVTNGPCSASSNVTVNFYQQPVANAGTGGNNCGLEFYLNAVLSVVTATGTWTKVSGPGTATFSPNNHTATAKVTVSVYGTYVFRWTEVNGPCTSRASVTVGFFEQVSANAGNGGDECDKDFLLNAVPGTGTGTWSKVSGPGNATFSPNAHQYNATVTVTQTGAYDFAWTEVNNNCSSVDIIRVVFHAPPSINAGPDAAVCKGGSIKLQAEGSGTFLWSPENLLSNPAIADPVATPVATTVFTVTLTDQWHCKNSDQVTIEVREKPVVNAGPDQILDFLFETELEATALNNHETGEWKILAGTGTFSDKNSNKTNVSELSLGDNNILWTVTNGVCTGTSDTVLVKINDLIIPTLITPNHDSWNELFIIRGLESLGRTTLTVFNRWGAIVYTDDNYWNDWDGKDYNGNPLQDDTYYYVLKPEKIKPIKGFIVIKR